MVSFYNISSEDIWNIYKKCCDRCVINLFMNDFIHVHVYECNCIKGESCDEIFLSQNRNDFESNNCVYLSVCLWTNSFPHSNFNILHMV